MVSQMNTQTRARNFTVRSATIEDIVLILRFIQELADYENSYMRLMSFKTGLYLSQESLPIFSKRPFVLTLLNGKGFYQLSCVGHTL